jgi:hypothetical protein
VTSAKRFTQISIRITNELVKYVKKGKGEEMKLKCKKKEVQVEEFECP